jgi:predicted RNA binding protein YcfA (HicA-like mRNA interferase family)
VNDYSPTVKKILRDAGRRFVRQGRGDHQVWESPHSGRRLPVDDKIKSRHTANGIMKQAGLEKKF